MEQKKHGRIWELDAFRGLCILGMVVIHTMFDLVELTGLVNWEYPGLFSFLKDWGGGLFLVLSGVCVTLGTHHVKRGLEVFGCGMLCTAFTAGMYVSGMAPGGIIIYFGALHCLGVCMMLWCLFRRLPDWALAVLGCVFVGIGLYIHGKIFDFPWLIPLGFQTETFSSSDYFPLFPQLGFFLLGAVLGHRAYGDRKSKFPRVDPSRGVIPFLTACGRQALLIYLVHQPVIAGVMLAVRAVFRR